MKDIKVNHNDPKQKESDKKQLEFCKNKCNENCSECNIRRYSGLFS